MTKRFLVKEFGYEINENGHGLQFVLLGEKAVEKIAQNYQEKYQIAIEAIESNEHNLEENLEEKIKYHTPKMACGEALGIVMIEKLGEKILHGSPLILLKTHQNNFVIIDFSANLCFTELQKKLKEENFQFFTARGYSHRQRDGFSCTIFSVNLLKHYLIDKDFIADFDHNAQEKKGIIELKDSVLNQISSVFDDMQKDKSLKYVHNSNGTKNLKSFYKGHDYARKINPNHMLLLNEETRKLVEKIDKIRAQAKFSDEPSSLYFPVASALDDIKLSCNIL